MYIVHYNEGDDFNVYKHFQDLQEAATFYEQKMKEKEEDKTGWGIQYVLLYKRVK